MLLSTILVVLILCLAVFTQSALGFGSALIAMPLLALAVGIHTATPLVGLVGNTISLLILARNWRLVDVQSARRLIISSWLGIPIGLVLLTQAPEHLVKGLLGALLIVFGLYNLLQFRLPTLHQPGVAYLLGFVAGILGGAYNTNGPPVIIYGMIQRWPPQQFRATLQGFFASTGIVIVLGQGMIGLWTADVFRLYGCALPFVLVAIALGSKCNRAMSQGQFAHIVYLGIIVMGLLLFI